MAEPELSAFRLGPWRVYPERGLLEANGRARHLSPRSMEVLAYLARRDGAVVGREELNEALWSPAIVTDDALTRCISELRRALDDSATQPSYIETIPKRGYRLLESALPLEEPPPGKVSRDRPIRAALLSRRWRLRALLIALAVVVAVAAAVHLDAPEPGNLPPASVAVLPLADLSPGDLPIAEGMHQELLTRLSAYDELRVISGNSVRRYRDGELSTPEIAEELGVDWIVEGAVQRAGERFRVSVQLINALTDSLRWARNYQGNLTVPDLFEVQRAIVDDIAESLHAELAPGAKRQSLPTENLTAYAMTVRAQTLLRQRSESTMRQAAGIFERAAGLDGDYAEPLAGWANALFLLHYYGYEPADSALPRARELSEQALARDPELPRARMVHALTRLYLDRDLAGALAELRAVHRRAPDYVGWLAWIEAAAGELESGLARMEEQIRSAPFSPGVAWSLATLNLAADDLERALALTRRAAELSPGYGAAYLTEAQLLLLEGEYEQAIEIFDKVLESFPQTEPAAAAAWKTAAQLRAGTIGPSAEAVESALALEDPFARAIVYVALGDVEAAFGALMAVEWNDVYTIYIRYHPWFDDLRGRPRYAELIERLDRSWGLDR